MRALALASFAAAAAAPAAGAEVIWAVGDGGVPEPEDDAVAARIGQEGIDRLLYLGDVYETGTAEEFRRNYGPSFGRFYTRTHPTPGNHEWPNRATGYDPYWGARAPQNAGAHAYSFDAGGWHFVSLNTEEDHGPSSAQVQWLRRDLAAYSGTCTIAFFHDPRYSAGPGTRDATDQEPFWAALAGRAVAAFSGHDHNYQRMRPVRGITQWVVGTGGRGLYPTDEADPRLLAVNDTAHGALKLRTSRGRLDFEFVRTDGVRLDSGSLGCTPHASGGSPPPPPPSPSPSPSPSPGTSPPPSPGTSPPPSPPSLPATAVRPRVRILGPRDGARVARRTVRLRGTASVPRRSHLLVTLTRRSGRACRSFDGRRFRRVRCSRPPTFAVRVGSEGRWRVRLRRPPAGRYRLTARIKDASRTITARAPSVDFRVRR